MVRCIVHPMDSILVAVIFTMGSGGASNAVAGIAHVPGHTPILVRAFTSQEVEVGSGTARLLASGTPRPM
jgi:hypothetical protein